MFTTGKTACLAEWIIDDICLIFLYFCPLQNRAIKNGCDIMDSFVVGRVESNGTNVVQVFENGDDGRVVQAKGMIVCTGPWTNRVLQTTG